MIKQLFLLEFVDTVMKKNLEIKKIHYCITNTLLTSFKI